MIVALRNLCCIFVQWACLIIEKQWVEFHGIYIQCKDIRINFGAARLSASNFIHSSKSAINKYFDSLKLLMQSSLRERDGMCINQFFNHNVNLKLITQFSSQKNRLSLHQNV